MAGASRAQAQVGARRQTAEIYVVFDASAGIRRDGESRAASAVAISPGAPLPTGRPSMRTTGSTIWLAEVMKASRAA